MSVVLLNRNFGGPLGKNEELSGGHQSHFNRIFHNLIKIQYLSEIERKETFYFLLETLMILCEGKNYTL